MLHRVEDRAVQERDLNLLNLVHRALGGIIEIQELQNAFLKTPHGQIEGDSGVKVQLGISRNAVYLRLRGVGLEPEDFRRPNVTLVWLIGRSRITGSILAELKERDQETSEKSLGKRLERAAVVRVH
jgi:hypothetical protein